MTEDKISEELQFDDLIDITEAFKPTEEEQKEKDSEFKQVTIDPNEDLQKIEDRELKDKKKVKKEVEVTTQEEEETETEESDETEDLTEEEKGLLQQVTDLRQMGALILPDDYEVESLEKALEDSEKYRNNLSVSTVFNQIPDIEIPGVGNSKDLFAYLFEHKGSSIDEFKKNFGTETFDPAKFNLEKEEDRKKVLDMFYTEKGFTEVKKAKIISKIFDDLEDEAESKDAMEELTKISEDKRKLHLIKLQENEVERQAQAQRTFEALNDIVQKSDVIAGYPIGKEEKPKALNSLYRTVNVGGQVTTDFNYRLNGVVLQNPELTLALSAFLNTLSKNDKGKMYFDMSKFERREKTKVVSNLRDIASRVASGSKKLSSSEDVINKTKKGFKWDSVVDYNDLP